MSPGKSRAEIVVNLHTILFLHFIKMNTKNKGSLYTIHRDIHQDTVSLIKSKKLFKKKAKKENCSPLFVLFD